MPNASPSPANVLLPYTPISPDNPPMQNVDQQYRTDANLRARVETHQRYTIGPELEPAIDTALALVGTESLLDIGTAYGDFPARLRAAGHRGGITGVDLQSGMIAEAHRRHPDIEFALANAQQLPFADASFDVVTARHMLYHVPDIPKALAEARRVLRHGGKFLAVTNTADNMGPFWEVVHAAAQRYRPLSQFATRVVSKFSDVNAEAFVAAAFGNSAVTRLAARLEFPSPEPVERYFLSCLPGQPDLDPDAALGAFRTALTERFPARGKWIVPKTVMLISARAT